MPCGLGMGGGARPSVRWLVSDRRRTELRFTPMATVSQPAALAALNTYRVPLYPSGLSAVNISLDTLKPERFERLARR